MKSPILSLVGALSVLVSMTSLMIPQVSAHGCLLNIKGGNGKVGHGFGVNGIDLKGHEPFYYAPRFLQSANTACGQHRFHGGTTFYTIDWKSELRTQVKNGLPTPQSNTLTVDYFQANEDGAGPFKCDVTSDANLRKWTSMKVLQNVAGSNGGRSSGGGKIHTLRVEVPKGTKCNGYASSCVVRCTNPNVNPFGGCFAFTSSNKSKRYNSILDEDETYPYEDDDEDGDGDDTFRH